MKGNIRYFDDIPHYDLDADTVSYVAHVKFKGDFWKAIPLMKRVSDEEMKQTRLDANSKVFFSKSGEKKLRENKMAYHRFVLRNFIQFFQVVPEHRTDIHRQILQLNPDLRLAIYYQSVRGVKFDEEAEILVDYPEDELADLPVIVPLIQTFYDPESEKEVVVRMVHHMRESEELRQVIEDSVKTRTSPGKFGALIKAEIDYDKIVEDYKNSSIKVEGYSVGAVPCEEHNKQDWIEKIPFEHIMLVMDRVQTDVAEIR